VRVARLEPCSYSVVGDVAGESRTALPDGVSVAVALRSFLAVLLARVVRHAALVPKLARNAESKTFEEQCIREGATVAFPGTLGTLAAARVTIEIAIAGGAVFVADASVAHFGLGNAGPIDPEGIEA
jgi:hypothetical protein